MVHKRQVIELEFHSKCKYSNPYMDVVMKVGLKSPDGKSFIAYGFWNGEDSWKVRIAPEHTGKWTWESSCTNAADEGLHGKSGGFDVVDVSDGSMLYRHGHLKVNDNGRGFVHENGTPFFWMGDTVWACPSRTTPEEWDEYTSFRSRQGFNIAQVSFLPQHDASGTDCRTPFEWSSGLLNPEKLKADYFKTLDRMVETALEKEMFTAGVVLWFDFVPGANPTWKTRRHGKFTPHLAEVYGRYLAARYAAYGVIWLISGDSDFSDEKAVAVYDAAARAIKEASTYSCLMSAHLHGGTYTPELLNNREWLDFHMYQASHNPQSHLDTMRYAEKDMEYTPARPVLNGEPPYENIGYHMKPERIDREYVRKVAWHSILSGGSAGITYGGHGLWSWHRQGEEFAIANEWQMPEDWRQALKFEGANDFIRLKRFMERFEWWKLRPAKGLAKYDGDREAVCAVIGDLLLTYADSPAKLYIKAGDFPKGACRWYNPSDHTEAPCDAGYENGSLVIQKSPFPKDSILMIEGFQ